MVARRHTPEAYGAALLALPGMGPARSLAVVRAFGFRGGWERILNQSAHRHPTVAAALGAGAEGLARMWSRDAARVEPARLLAAHHEAGIEVAALGSDRYPPALAGDVEPPVVLFWRGDLGAVAARRVAIVGTRRCTPTGRQVARALGEDLAAAGVSVVSGLALGIDGAAHEGALQADPATPPLGVVGSGLDVVYPPRHGALWRRMAEVGALISEAPLGSEPLPWRFPARNRLIAALAEVVVVVESHRAGGALHTVDEALRRDRTVLAVPGPVTSAASEGTNALLFDGVAPARGAADVLLALELEVAAPPVRVDPRRPPSPADSAILAMIGAGAVSLDMLTLRSGSSVGELSLALLRLEEAGWIAVSGSWIERVGP